MFLILQALGFHAFFVTIEMMIGFLFLFGCYTIAQRQRKELRQAAAFVQQVQEQHDIIKRQQELRVPLSRKVSVDNLSRLQNSMNGRRRSLECKSTRLKKKLLSFTEPCFFCSSYWWREWRMQCQHHPSHPLAHQKAAETAAKKAQQSRISWLPAGRAWTSQWPPPRV